MKKRFWIMCICLILLSITTTVVGYGNISSLRSASIFLAQNSHFYIGNIDIVEPLEFFEDMSAIVRYNEDSLSVLVLEEIAVYNYQKLYNEIIDAVESMLKSHLGYGDSSTLYDMLRHYPDAIILYEPTYIGGNLIHFGGVIVQQDLNRIIAKVFATVIAVALAPLLFCMTIVIKEMKKSRGT